MKQQIMSRLKAMVSAISSAYHASSVLSPTKKISYGIMVAV